jgi:hypothetical protein
MSCLIKQNMIVNYQFKHNKFEAFKMGGGSVTIILNKLNFTPHLGW